MFTSGEEKGLWGSQAFVANAWFPGEGKPAANINLDMVGRNAGQQLALTPFEEKHPAFSALAQLARELAPSEGFTQLTSCDQYYHRSDNYSFAQLGIPVLSLYDDMTDDYHQPSDRPEKVDGDKIRRVTRLVMRILSELQDAPLERAR